MADDFLRGVILAGRLADVIDAVGPAPVLAGLAAAVGLRRVQQGDAVLQGVIQDAERGRFVDLAAEGHAAQADPADPQFRSANDPCFQGFLLLNRHLVVVQGPR